MFVISADRQKIVAASYVAKHAELRAVTIASLKTDGDPRALIETKEMKSANIEPAFRAHHTPTPGTLIVEVSVRVTLGARRATDSTHEQPPLTIDTAWRLEYAIPEEPVPDEAGDNPLQCFAELNGMTNCWPYVRVEVQRLTTAMGLPTFTMPLLVVRAEEAEEPEVHED